MKTATRKTKVPNIDQIARDIAQKAVSMIEAHERVCAERAHNMDATLTEVDTKLTEISSAVAGLYTKWWTASVAGIAILLTVIGYLINKHGI